MTTNNEVSIHSEKDVNKLTKLLREQRQDFFVSFVQGSQENDALFIGSAVIFDWHTTAQQQLIDVIIENVKSYDGTHIESDIVIKHIITLLEEAKKNL